MAEDSPEVVKEMAESVAAVNLKNLGDAPAFYSSLAMSNAVAQQNSQFQLGNAILGKIAEMIIATSPSEGGADVAALVQLAKMGVNTPPVGTAPNVTPQTTP